MLLHKQRIVIYPIYITIFVLSSYLTSLLTDIRFKDMAVFTATVVIYWFIAVVITKIHDHLTDAKRLIRNTVVSLFIIILVTSLQLLMFINIPVSSSISFFVISFAILIVFFLLLSKIK